MSSFSSGRCAVYKNTTDNKLKKNRFLRFRFLRPCRTSLVQFRQFNSVRRFNYSSMVLQAIKENLRCAEAFLLRTGRLFFIVFFKYRDKLATKQKKVQINWRYRVARNCCGFYFLRFLRFFQRSRKNNFPFPPKNKRKHFFPQKFTPEY